MKKTKKKSTANHYFTSAHERAIIQYAQTDCIRERTKLYVEMIGPVFDEMVDKIIYTYKFTSLPNIDSLKRECKIWLVTVLDKFDQSRGYKAFSYFSVVTKNWFIHKVKVASKKCRQEVQYDEISKDLEHEYLSENNLYEAHREQSEFWSNFLSEMENWEKCGLRPNEEKVLLAVKDLLANLENIEIFNKKAFYLYLRELTNLNTKQIVSSLTKMREKYLLFKKKWNAGEI